MLQRNGFKSPP
ncbi:hypothetical protein F383_37559 [Gossypium arboreum]|uniref:Uncharacterized protein n=1 Tax=Gossypium arboreum TaxID=29729 RepID=A0A0B0MD50_GOSAR|nr:hypothetical protein F383_37559 [Gossypium arboreum]